MRIGLLLPHFGPSTSYERLFGLPGKLTGAGFSSLWVRDQLGFEGGMSFEPRSNHFVDPFIALAGIAAQCDLRVGTATLTPIRQPLVLAQLVGSLSYLSKGRLVLGVGLGGDRRAFELAGLRFEDRGRLFEDMVNVLRATASANASYEGHFVRFRDVSLDPAPPADLTVWYCGSSVGATRRAVRFASGWFPGRCPFRVFDRLHEELREHAAKAGLSPSVAVVPIVSVDKTREAALAKVNVQGLLADARSKPAWQADGPFETADDLAGALIVGPPEDVARDLKALEDRGVDEVVIDLRLRMDRFDETIELLNTDVLPLFQGGTP
jgi:alkanesulfonate monooxygenase SsuD/methylene tetrahydromethanopterin reductase-like flavin-dependent oxidoreductase (luciferase family)